MINFNVLDQFERIVRDVMIHKLSKVVRDLFWRRGGGGGTTKTNRGMRKLHDDIQYLKMI